MAITRRMERVKAELEAKAKVSKKLPCRYFNRGDAFCKHGDECYYLHKAAKHKVDKVDNTCHICFEVPSTYGILSACKHKFCLTCIYLWDRQQVTDLPCPLCRTVSQIIVPANYAPSPKQCQVLVQTMIDRCATVPCRWFESSKLEPRNPFDPDSGLQPYCPAFNECYFRHEIDGKRYVFSDEEILDLKTNLEAHFPGASDLGEDDYLIDDRYYSPRELDSDEFEDDEVSDRDAVIDEV